MSQSTFQLTIPIHISIRKPTAFIKRKAFKVFDQNAEIYI